MVAMVRDGITGELLAWYASVHHDKGHTALIHHTSLTSINYQNIHQVLATHYGIPFVSVENQLDVVDVRDCWGNMETLL